MISARTNRRGFTLIEVLVAAGLLAVGIFATLGALGSLAKSERNRQTTEYMLRLAERRYEEQLVVNQNPTSPTNGDFQDWNEPNYVWSTQVGTTGNANLYSITLTVTPSGRSSPAAKVTGLQFIPQTTTTSTTGAATP